MNIEQIDIYKLNIKRKEPTKISIGILDKAENIAIKITATNGIYGWGEGSPFSPITGDSQETNLAAAKQVARLIIGKNPLAIEARMAQINVIARGEPSLRAALDMALYDLAAKVAGLPLYALLGGGTAREKNGTRSELRTDMTVGMQETVDQTIICVEHILAAGFNAIKLKVGRANLEDVQHVLAVRDLIGPEIPIKIDSNQGWSYQEALANIKAMEPANLQYSEQPLAAWDYDNMRRLRDNVRLPICADESVFDDRDALRLIKADAVDYLNIKLGKAGGIYTGLKINAIAEAAGCKCMIGCFGESRLALSAAAHLAMARSNIHFLDLDSAYKHKDDPVNGGMIYDNQHGGIFHVPDMPGHGASFDESALSNKISVV